MSAGRAAAKRSVRSTRDDAAQRCWPPNGTKAGSCGGGGHDSVTLGSSRDCSDVHEEVGDQVCGGAEEGNRNDRWVVDCEHGRCSELADSWPVEDDLDEEGAGQRVGGSEADDRQRLVAEHFSGRGFHRIRPSRSP